MCNSQCLTGILKNQNENLQNGKHEHCGLALEEMFFIFIIKQQIHRN
jgi:hypothetical protein